MTDNARTAFYRTAAEIGLGVLVALVFILAAVAAAPRAEAVPAPTAVELTEAEAERVSWCTDGLPVYRDRITGALYGDQDDNGILDGADCQWT